MSGDNTTALQKNYQFMSEDNTTALQKNYQFMSEDNTTALQKTISLCLKTTLLLYKKLSVYV
jgi:hypothetical protein